MSQELNPGAIELLNALNEAFSGKKKKAKKTKNKFVMIVDGKVMSQLIPTRKDAEAAARTIILRTMTSTGKEPVVAIAAITETLTIDVPIGSAETDGIEG